MLADRVTRAVRLDSSLYAEIEQDPSAMADALGLVLMVAAAAALGLFLQPIFGGARGLPFRLFSGTMVQVIVGWLIWSVVSYQVGTKFLGGAASLAIVLRALAFAQAPTLLLVLQFIPVVAPLLRLVVTIWVIGASFMAIRESLRIATNPAVIVTLVSFVAASIVTAVLGALDIGRVLSV